jgi:hypothetical protein
MYFATQQPPNLPIRDFRNKCEKFCKYVYGTQYHMFKRESPVIKYGIHENKERMDKNDLQYEFDIKKK